MAEHFDVIVIGAGLSGIGAAWRLREQLPGAIFTILEARGAIGGTWDLFRYPGVRSDSDMFTLSYPFRPWRGAESIASGDQIRRYIAETADEGGITGHIRFGCRVVTADWSSRAARWTLTLTDGTTLTCDFVYACAGYYSYVRGYRPDFPGLGSFAGRVVHPQSWPADLDHSGKRVVVIGSGATAVTLVPALADTAVHVTMLQRSPSYVLAQPERDAVAAALRKVLPATVVSRLARAKNILLSQGFYQFARRRPGQARRLLRALAVRGVGNPAVVNDHFTPRYDPWDQRLCVIPSGDLWTAIRSGRASVVTDHIDEFVPEGIRLRSGRVVEADVVVTATGLSLIPLGGIALSLDGRPVDIGGRTAYRGLMLSGVPNLAFCVGYVNASWTLRADLVHRYVCRLLRHMRRHGFAAAVPQAPGGPGRPLLDLSSSYVQRALATFPRQGDRDPWLVRQNYLRDLLTTPRADVTRDMVFEPSPSPVKETDHMNTYRFAGHTAVVTGAASGIGECLAYDLAGRGSDLVLVDVDGVRLLQVADRIGRAHPGRLVRTIVADLSSRSEVDAVASRVLTEHPAIGLLVNNAGVALGGRFDEVTTDEFEHVMNVNFRAPMLLTHALLPALKATPGSHLVNVSSLFGLIAPAGQSAYSASKFALRGLSQALAAELADDGIGVTTVHPGGIATRIADNARVGRDVPEADVEPHRTGFAKLLTYPPEKAARQILDGVARRKPRVLIAVSAKAPDLLARLFPVAHARIVRAAISTPRHRSRRAEGVAR